MTIDNSNLFFELIQVSLGQRDSLSNPLSKQEWVSIYEETIRQSISGFVFEGIQRLPKEQWPPQVILFQWLGIAEQIRKQNELLNQKVVELSHYFDNEGYRSCVLKGQGNALMYQNPLCRQSGDIDVWVDINDIVAISWVKKMDAHPHYQYHHVDFSIFKDVSVELHYRPSYSNIFIYNRRFQRFFRKEKERQFSNKVQIPSCLETINIPTYDFNCIFQMSHMFNHYITGGIGLRQIIDYFFLLKMESVVDQSEWEMKFRRFGMLKFAKGIMWIEQEVLGLDQCHQLVEGNKIVGEDILLQVMKGGNWGQYLQKSKFKSAKLNYLTTLFLHDIHIFRLFPLQVIAQPFSLMWHQWWKLKMRVTLYFCDMAICIMMLAKGQMMFFQSI